MSTEEQDRLLGSLTRQSAECNQTIAALEVKVTILFNALRNIAEDLSGIINPKGAPVLTIDQGFAALPGLPERQEIIYILNELRTERNRARKIAEQLASMNQ